MIFDIIVLLIIIGAAFGLLILIINGKATGGGGSFTAASAFADMQNEDKRNAMEVVIEMKSGKKQFEQESGDKEKLES